MPSAKALSIGQPREVSCSHSWDKKRDRLRFEPGAFKTILVIKAHEVPLRTGFILLYQMVDL